MYRHQLYDFKTLMLGGNFPHPYKEYFVGSHDLTLSRMRNKIFPKKSNCKLSSSIYFTEKENESFIYEHKHSVTRIFVHAFIIPYWS